jgi:hypothetical protein
MAVLGFSLNNLTLFGLVLAIGIVVDDAIVVVENVERHIEDGLEPVEAARKAMDEVTGAVIAIAFGLSAVFVPTAFLGGIAGQFYRQFALTIAISTVISAFNSLTLSPALASRLLRPHGAPRDRAPVEHLAGLIAVARRQLACLRSPACRDPDGRAYGVAAGDDAPELQCQKMAGPNAEFLKGCGHSVRSVRRRYFASNSKTFTAAGITQLVILGAGLDTLAERRPELGDRLRIFEVDQPGTQAWKRRRLVELGVGVPGWLRLVPIDFERGDDLQPPALLETDTAQGLASGQPLRSRDQSRFPLDLHARAFYLSLSLLGIAPVGEQNTVARDDQCSGTSREAGQITNVGRIGNQQGIQPVFGKLLQYSPDPGTMLHGISLAHPVFLRVSLAWRKNTVIINIFNSLDIQQVPR